MDAAWTLVADDASALAGVPVAGQDTMTMVEGSSFCLCSSSGDITPGNSHGVFYADTRVLSQWEMEIDDEPVEPTQALSTAPYHAMFLGRVRARPGHVDSTLLVRRERYVGAGMREDLALVNLGAEATTCTVTITTGCDVADLFEVKAERLMSPYMFNGFGVRTLAASTAAYNPMSYHNGSVWPHDGAICAAGLMRYGFVDAAQQICLGLLAAATSFGGRLPELFCGFDRHEYPAPMPYPTSCSPQAWAAAAPIHLLRTLLRFDPSVPDGTLRIAPALPAGFGTLRVTGMPLAGALLTVEVDEGRVEVHDLPPGLKLVTDPQ